MIVIDLPAPLEYCHTDSVHAVCDLENPARGDNTRKGMRDRVTAIVTERCPKYAPGLTSKLF